MSKHTENTKNPLDYACKACNALMAKYRAEELPPAGRFHYHQGVFLSAMEQCLKITGDKAYAEYIKRWVDSIIYADGSIHKFDQRELDDIQPGNLLFRLYEETGDERYQKALSVLVSLLQKWPCDEGGGFWHKEKYPNEMWLDGLYMAGPIAARYAFVFDQPDYYDIAAKQAIIMGERTHDKATGLVRHANAYHKQTPWASPVDGRSPEFWGRSIGWYLVALLDILVYLPQDHQDRSRLTDALCSVLKAVVKYQDVQTGMWYQVVDKADQDDNWAETSCTALFSYAIARAVEAGYLTGDYLSRAWSGFYGLLNYVGYDDNGNLMLSGICIGTCVGDYDYYVARETSTNDLHGMGAFILMCTALHKAQGGEMA